MGKTKEKEVESEKVYTEEEFRNIVISFVDLFINIFDRGIEPIIFKLASKETNDYFDLKNHKKRQALTHNERLLLNYLRNISNNIDLNYREFINALYKKD